MGDNIIVDCYNAHITEYNSYICGGYRDEVLCNIISCLQVNLCLKDGRTVRINNANRVFEIDKNTYIAQTPDNDIGFHVINDNIVTRW